MLVKADPRTMVMRKQKDRMAADKRKAKQCRFRMSVGGPYMGRGGKRGFVLAAGTESRSVASVSPDVEESVARGLSP